MICPSCAHENRPGAKFCKECASPLKRACASCGAELAPGSKFCDECGAAAGAVAAKRPAEASDARKVVTIVFADLVGSTALHERLDPESARRFMEGYYAAMRGAVESHGGSVTQFLGDGVKAVFGVPRVAEDDAIRAVRAAVAMQESFRALADAQREAVGKTGLRVAVNTGEVVANDATEIIGDPVNVAARLQEQGRDGDVVVGESTQALVETLVTLELLGSFALKGRSEAVKAYRVISLERPAGAAASPFVGREDELARIGAVYEMAVSKPATGLAVLLGSPGLGKSRLIDELALRLGGGAIVIRAHCDASGGASFAPLADALRTLPDLDAAVSGSDAERARILDGVRALLAGSPAPPEETFFVVRRLLSALAATKPVVLVIDDLHWAEPLLLDLVEHLVQWGSGVPLLVLAGARPELREMRSSLTLPGGLVSEVITLAGLDAGAAMRLAANVIGAADLPASVAAKVLATSEGNPLFVGELVRMLVHEGALKKEGERWTAGTSLAALEMPPTIHALLAARIERLRPEERGVLERAAVIGRHFSRGAVADLLARDSADLDARLESLRRAELIERDSGWFFGEPGLRFHHVLIRDAAYRRILKGTRAELHTRFADWIESRAGDSIEHDETIGWHLEQAHQHLRELGPIDARGRALGERAAARLSAAGRRALARDDVPLASGLLGRALDRLDRNDPGRAALALDWCEALLAAGDVGPATAALEELDRFAASDARLRAWHTCFAGQLTVLTAPSGLKDAAESVATAARDLAALGDVAGEAKAHFVQAQAFARLGKVGACEAALDRALAAARRADDRRRANTVLAVAPLAALWGPSPVTRASGRCLDVVRVLRITQGAPAVEAVALSCQGVLEALRGRTDAARRMIASARKMVEELGITQRLLEADVFAARIDLLDGDAASAERGLRAAYDGMRELGLGIDAAQAAALLARALLQLDRAAEAEELTRESERLAGDDLQSAIAWRGARAEALARRGETVEAVALATKAVEIAAETDALLDHADARLALAAALRAAGRGTEADTEERRATELWEAKGATLLAERARRESPLPAAAAAQPESRIEAARPARLLVRASRATASAGRFEAAVAARDVAALEDGVSDPCVVVHHATGVTYGRREHLSTWKAAFRAGQVTYRREVLGTLGDSLELWRHWISTSGLVDASFASFGTAEFEEIVIGEDDGYGRYRRFEIFPAHQLGQAVSRFYERYAELLPDGPKRERAAATARSATVMLGQPDLTATATVLAPDVEFSDLRTVGFGTLHGAEAVLQTIAAMMDLSRDDSARIDDVVVLEPDAMVVRWTNRGTHLESGGAFERNLCQLFAFDSAGLLSRWQQFEAEHDDAALARFDALVAGAEPNRSARSRVRPNAATANVSRFGALMAARDLAAVRAMLAPDFEGIHHPTAMVGGPEGPLAVYAAWLRAGDPQVSHEALATLGVYLGLFAQRRSISGLVEGEGIDAGAAVVDDLVLIEVEASGKTRRTEVFASNHLGDAIARLYERFAEISPEGPARERAAATSRAVTAMVTASVEQDFAASVTPDFVAVDHRLVGHAAVGAGDLERGFAAWRELTDDVQIRVDAVLALSSDALLRRSTSTGIVRASGGAFERSVIMLSVFGPDGRIARTELFDATQKSEALARFDALVAGNASKPPVRRRVRANLATAALARFDAGCAARDVDAVNTVHREDFEEVHHPTASRYGLEAAYASLDSLLRLPGPRMVHEPLATLGDVLGLSHRTTGASSGGRGRVDSGAWDREEFVVAEVDEQGRLRCFDTFSDNHLGDAVARLYERYAEIRADGSERSLAATTARSLAALLGPPDIDRIASAISPSVETHDHKVLGYGRARGAENVLRAIRVQLETADDIVPCVDEVLALHPRALLVRRTVAGASGVGGGRYEKEMLSLYACGSDGRVEKWEQFDPDREADALARFDALVGGGEREPGSEPFANASARADRRLFECFNTRDWPGIEMLAAPELVFDERRRMVRNTCGREVWLEQFRILYDVPSSRFTSDLLATRGERLSLNLHRFGGNVAGGGGPLAMDDHFALHEVDREGRIVAIVLFDPHDLDAAHAELDARFDAGEGAAHARTLAAWRRRERAFAIRDWDDLSASYTGRVFRDHRLLGWGTTPRRDWVSADQIMRSLVDLAPDVQRRHDHVRLCERGLLAQTAQVGTRDGGAFEIAFLAVYEWDVQGRCQAIDNYDVDRFDLAWARFEELRAAAPTIEPFANAAWGAFQAYSRAWIARDWKTIEGHFSPSLRMDDRRRMVRLQIGVEDFLTQLRMLFEQPGGRWQQSLIATRGDRLALSRGLFHADVEGGGGPLEFAESLSVYEIGSDGRIVALVVFDPEDCDAAYAELDARYDAGEGAVHGGAFSRWLRAWAARDWNAVAATYAPNHVERDHRPLALLGTRHGGEAATLAERALVELAPDTVLRLEHVRPGPRCVLFQNAYLGSREGSEYQMRFVAVGKLDANCRFAEFDFWEPEQIELALARFAELASPARAESPFANAASRLVERGVGSSWAARDWGGIVAEISPAMRMDDRRRIMRLEIGYEDFLVQFRMMFDQPGSRWRETLLATRGERLSLHRTLFEAEVAGGGGPLAFDEHLSLTEVDTDGRWIASVTFDLEDGDAARAELDARFEAGEDTTHGLHRTIMRAFARAAETRDWNPVLALCAPTLVEHDHRPLAVLGTTRGAEAWVQNFRVLVELAPDSRYRVDHFRSTARGFCTVGVWEGTREGGSYEIPLVAVIELDEQKHMARADIYDADQLERARARFDELGAAATTPTARFASAATRALDAIVACWLQRDWERYERLFAPGFRYSDRRPLVQLELDRDRFMAFVRQIGDMAVSRFELNVLATRGERLVLARSRNEVEDGDVGQSEIESLGLFEVGEDGLLAKFARFDLDDDGAAYAELDARYQAGEAAQARAWTAAQALLSAADRRDWDAVPPLLAPGFAQHDHRRLGWGSTLDSPEMWLRAQQAFADLSPDFRYRTDHARISERSALLQSAQVGTRDGGAFKTPLVAVFELDDQGRIGCIDTYDLDQLDQAFARFDELATDAPLRPRFENAATRNVDRATTAQGARDLEGFGACFASEFRNIDRRPLNQLDLDREQFLAGYRQINEMTSSRPTSEVLATRGDRMALVRVGWHGAEGDVGPSEIDWLLVIEVNGHGETVVSVVFDADDLAAAGAELDARFEAGEGAAHPRALAAMLAARRALEARDWDGFSAVYDPEVVCHDHRLLGWGTLHGVAAFVRTQQVLVELAPDSRWRADHVATCERGHFQSSLLYGTRDGGPFELAFLRVSEVDARGKVCRIDLYDPSKIDEARARFAELRASALPPLGRFENVASRAWRKVFEAWRRRDMEGFAPLHSPALRYRDHRRMFQLDLDREQFLAFTRPLLEIGTASASAELLATRGERLALFRFTMEMESGDVGPSAIDSLNLVESAETGEIVAYARFDLEDLDAAWAELDARWQAGEAATHQRAAAWVAEFQRAFASRDWKAMAALSAPDQVAENHRTVGWGTMRGLGAWVRALEVLVELAVDTRLRIDHLCTCERGFLWTSLWHGTRDGGAFETPWIMFAELDANGKESRLDVWDIEQLGEAFDRFESLRATTPGQAGAAGAQTSAASAAMERWQAAFDIAFVTGDWQPMRVLCAPEMLFDDRRRLALLSGGLELMIASARERVAMGARPEVTTIGTAGDRVAILRVLWGGGPENGRFEIEYLAVVEIDASALISAIVFVDPDDSRAAQREAWARWFAIDPAAAAVARPIGEQVDAYNARDWVKYRAIFADDVVVEDHRLAGMGHLVGAEAYVASVVALWRLSPISSAAIGWLWPAFEWYGAITVVRRTGTVPDGGGDFESENLSLYLVARGRITRIELFELDALDSALARFAELRPDPLRIPPNAAARGRAPIAELLAKGDVAAVRALASDDFSYEDRGRQALVRGGVEEWLRALQFLVTETGAVLDTRLVATAGERLALHRVVWHETPGKASFQIERLRLDEINAEGKLGAMVLFDADQRAAASDELFERWVASGADGVPAAEIEFLRAWNVHDLGRMRAVLPDDFVHDDRRRAGLGRVEGADAYVASAAALYELSPDVRIEELYCFDHANHARVSVVRRFGTNTEGGEAEAYFIRLAHFRRERLVGVDAFELEELDAALARFEALRPDPLRIPPNAATRANDRAALAIAAGDRASLRACASSDFRFEDRGKRALVVGDVEVWLDSALFLGSELRARLEPELLATLGDRIAVYRDAWSGSTLGGSFELGGIRIFEVDDKGKLRALLLFDFEDRAAAFAEANARFASGEAAGCAAARLQAEFLSAVNERDWSALRESYTPDMVVTDHRLIGLGVLDRDAWIASLQATVGLSVGLAFEVSRVLAWNERGIVTTLRRYGTIPDGGGPFENFPIAVVLTRGDRVARYELFEETDAVRAVARLAELTQA